MTKTKILETIQKMPEEIALEDFFEKLLFVQKVEEGLKQSKEGKKISNEAAKKRFEKWLQ